MTAPRCADRQEHANGLRLFDGFRWRQNPPHDEDLECGLGDEGTGLGLRVHPGDALPHAPLDDFNDTMCKKGLSSKAYFCFGAEVSPRRHEHVC
jgi:hypothetical protein